MEDERLKLLMDFRRQIPPRKLVINDDVGRIILTPRETQHLILMLEGKSMGKVAEELGVSQRTVESYLNNVKLKTGYTSKAKLLADFFEHQLYQPSVYYDRYN